MLINIDKDELNRYYNKARELCMKCFQEPENAYLLDEFPVPIEQLELRNENVKVVFDRINSDTFSFEISITLWDSLSIMVGRYRYIDDGQANVLEDSLVFF